MTTTKVPAHHYVNPYTGEIVPRSVQVCDSCHLNFTSSASGDNHRAYRPGQRYCLTPKQAGLVKLINSFGSTIYKTRNSPDPKWAVQILAP